jgi:hypothetical protein
MAAPMVATPMPPRLLLLPPPVPPSLLRRPAWRLLRLRRVGLGVPSPPSSPVPPRSMTPPAVRYATSRRNSSLSTPCRVGWVGGWVGTTCVGWEERQESAYVHAEIDGSYKV